MGQNVVLSFHPTKGGYTSVGHLKLAAHIAESAVAASLQGLDGTLA